MNEYTALWLLWLLQFLAIEGAALLNKRPNDTLSEHIWHVFSIRQKSQGWRVRRFSLLAFLAWLCAHFLSGGAF